MVWAEPSDRLSGVSHETDHMVATVAGLESLVARLEAKVADQDRKLAVQARQMVLKDRTR